MDISTEIYHLRQLPQYNTEKPYTMRYVPKVPLLESNVVREKKVVQIGDIRGSEAQYSLHENGFMVMRLASKMTYEDFHDQAAISTVYLEEVHGLLGTIFPNSEIDLVRRREQSFPYSTGEQYDFGQPNIVAHIDTTPADFRRQVRNRHGDRSSEILKQHCQYITIWKPLRGPLYDWPLALCDSRTVMPEYDLEPQDIVDREEVLENVHVYHRISHRWHYLSGQQDSEVLIFRQASLMPERFGIPHCAVENPKAPLGAPSRESIEVVAFVYNI